MSSAVTLKAVTSCLQHSYVLQSAFTALNSRSWLLSGPAWNAHSSSGPSASSTSTVTTRWYASNNAISSSSSATPLPPRQQQSSASFSTSPDAFTASLQSKTEQEVFQLMETARAAKLAEAAAAAKAAGAAGDAGIAAAAADAAAVGQLEDEEDDTIDVVNPETGEAYGPRGKEPTRYGDWEIKGRCTDFS